MQIVSTQFHESFLQFWKFPLARCRGLGASSDSVLLKTGIKSSPINLHGQRLVSLFFGLEFSRSV